MAAPKAAALGIAPPGMGRENSRTGAAQRSIMEPPPKALEMPRIMPLMPPPKPDLVLFEHEPLWNEHLMAGNWNWNKPGDDQTVESGRKQVETLHGQITDL